MDRRTRIFLPLRRQLAAWEPGPVYPENGPPLHTFRALVLNFTAAPKTDAGAPTMSFDTELVKLTTESRSGGYVSLKGTGQAARSP